MDPEDRRRLTLSISILAIALVALAFVLVATGVVFNPN